MSKNEIEKVIYKDFKQNNARNSELIIKNLFRGMHKTQLNLRGIFNQLQSFKILRDNVGDNDFNIYKENVINDTEDNINENKMNIIEEDGYDMQDNDNDEDDFIESEYS